MMSLLRLAWNGVTGFLKANELLASLAIFAAVLTGVSALLWQSSTMIARWKAELREQGASECRTAVAAVAHKAESEALRAALRRVQELESMRKTEVAEREHHRVEAERLHEIIRLAVPSEPSACLRPDHIVDALNKNLRATRSK